MFRSRKAKVRYIRSFILVGTFLSQITPLSPLHFDHAFNILLSAYLLAPPLLSIVDPKYLKDCTVGKLTVSVARYLFVLCPLLSVGVRVSPC